MLRDLNRKVLSECVGVLLNGTGSGAEPQRGKGAEPLKDVVFDLKSVAT